MTTPDHGQDHPSTIPRGERMPSPVGGPSLIGRLSALLRDRRGTVAMESGFTLIILVFLFVGLVESYFLLEANRRVTDATELTADLIAQQTSMTTSASVPSTSSGIMPMVTLFSAAQLMLLPLPTTGSNPTMDVASIYYNQSAALSVDWEKTQGSPATAANAAHSTVYLHFSTGCAASGASTCYCTLDPSTFSSATPTCLINQSLDYVYLTYQYSNQFALFAPISIGMTATGFMKPRTTPNVTMCTDPANATTCQ